MTAIVRRAQPSDAEAMFEIERAAAMIAFADVFPAAYYPYPDAANRRRWQDTLASAATVLLAERDGGAVGFVSVVPHRLEALFVIPAEWGTGLADQLHDHALMHLWETGCTFVELWVQETNERAKRFYTRHGWQADGRRSTVQHPPFPRLVGYSIHTLESDDCSLGR